MFVAPKIIAAIFVLVALLSTYLVAVLTALVIQTIKGYHDYQLDPSHYLVWYFCCPTRWRAIETRRAGRSSVQTLSPHKYIGWGV